MTATSARADAVEGKQLFRVGDLVIHHKWDLVYLLVQQDYAGKSCEFPYKVNQHALVGVVVHSSGKDDDGDRLPPVGYFHTGFSPRRFKHYTGTIKLSQ